MCSVRQRYTVMTNVSILWQTILRGKDFLFLHSMQSSTGKTFTTTPITTSSHTDNIFPQNPACWSCRGYFRPLQQKQSLGNRVLFYKIELISLAPVRLPLNGWHHPAHPLCAPSPQVNQMCAYFPEFLACSKPISNMWPYDTYVTTNLQWS